MPKPKRQHQHKAHPVADPWRGRDAHLLVEPKQKIEHEVEYDIKRQGRPGKEQPQADRQIDVDVLSFVAIEARRDELPDESRKSADWRRSSPTTSDAFT